MQPVISTKKIMIHHKMEISSCMSNTSTFFFQEALASNGYLGKFLKKYTILPLKVA